ncbi:MAG TPA: FTR1 family protein, partial [Solirubrobacteraceae bacterium]
MRRAFFIALLAVLAIPAAADAAGPPPWRAAGEVRDALFDAQAELIVGTRATAERQVDRGAAAYRGRLRAGVAAADPAADKAVRAALADARAAVARRDATALAAARGAARAAIFRGSYAATLAAVERGDAATARGWLLLREFRTATRFTRPGADGTLAVQRLAAGKLDAAHARDAVQKDLLDAYQARLRDLLEDASRGADRDLPVRRAEAAAQAQGYFEILAARYAQDRGAAATADARAAYADLRRTALGKDVAAFSAARDRAASVLEGFTAAPFSPEEAARRAQQLLRFLALVPVEYGRGVKGTTVHLDFEINEADAFRTGAVGAFADLRDQLAKRDEARTAAAAAGIDRLGRLVDVATKQKEGVPDTDTVKAQAEDIEDALTATMPDAWQKSTDESDYDLIQLTLDRMQAAAGAGQYHQAEQARLEAYSFFEFGPERRLKAFDPGLALTIEGMIWYGASGQPGLAKLIADRAPLREIRPARQALDTSLGDAAATLGDSTGKATVVTNSAILVFREGLEAVLILAAITASFVGARRRLRRPVLWGAMLGLLASIVTWVIASTLIESLATSGERLESITGLVAIGVLLLVTNWFFHRVYWSEWIGRFHRRRKALEKIDKTGFFSAQAAGFIVLGLTSVYREGFETVLFLQSLQVSAGTATVVEGAALGLALTFAVGTFTFVLQRKLPYKRMLVVTGVMIGFVLVVMVGQTARTMQGVGWLPITPIGGEPPYWLGVWFGVYPSWETLGAQLAAAVFVIGSFFVAKELKVKRPGRRAQRRAAVAQPT